MSAGIQTKVVATTFALAAFAAAMTAGMSTGNPAAGVIVQAMISMLVCYVIGLVIGAIVERTITDAMNSYQQAHPVPDVFAALEGDVEEEAEPASAEPVASEVG